LGATQRSSLRIHGTVPGFSPHFENAVRITVDGARVAESQLAPGDFEIAVPRVFAAGRHVVGLHFTNAHRLGPRDLRPASAYLRSIEFLRSSTQGRPALETAASGQARTQAPR
jgi:hypothetical protein